MLHDFLSCPNEPTLPIIIRGRLRGKNKKEGKKRERERNICGSNLKFSSFFSLVFIFKSIQIHIQISYKIITIFLKKEFNKKNMEISLTFQSGHGISQQPSTKRKQEGRERRSKKWANQHFSQDFPDSLQN